jgi:hypothetical protein
MMARLASQDLSAKFGQPFVVENRPSAGGALGTRAVASASPDGYTLEFSASSVVTLTPQVQKLDFDPAKELVPITNVGTGTQMIAIKRSLPAKTLPEFLAYAKANPGKLSRADRQCDPRRCDRFRQETGDFAAADHARHRSRRPDQGAERDGVSARHRSLCGGHQGGRDYASVDRRRRIHGRRFAPQIQFWFPTQPPIGVLQRNPLPRHLLSAASMLSPDAHPALLRALPVVM